MALTLKAPGTFRAAVKIPVPGGESEPIFFVFRHRTVAELGTWQKELAGHDLTNRQVVEACVVGWDLKDEFNSANVALLLENYHGAARAITDAYIAELTGARLGN